MALINLRKSLPKDIQIVLKEHPSQLYSNMRGSRGRSPLIYNLFKKVKGIKLVGNNYNTIYLIQKSKLVVTITGTVALEAAILEKPSITFGSTWYKGCPNIFEWKDNINLKDIINSKISSSNSVYDFLINHKNKYHILASMNLNEKDQFPEYFEESFFETEINNVYKILRQLFENKIK
jgi:CDP-glycerol glycerophosphotransferase (TagB/SpsB family)